MNFEPRAAKQLQAGQHLLVQSCPGLRLEATKTTKSWTYRYKNEAGRMKQAKLGQWPQMSLSAAITAWNAFREERSDGVDPVARRRAEKEIAISQISSCADLIGSFLTQFIDRQRKPESAKAARRALEKMLAETPSFARMRPMDVTRAVAYRLLDDRREFPMAAKKLRSLLGQAWTWAHDAGLLDPSIPNWWRQVMHGQLRSMGKVVGGQHVGRKKRVLTQAELAQLLPWARANMSQSSLDGFLLYLLTGMRGVEIFGMRVEYIAREHDGWWMTYPEHLLKTERHADTVDHRVPLIGEALEIVQRRMASAWDGWLFYTGRGKQLRPYHRNTFSSYVYSLMPDSAKAKRRAGEGLVAPVINWSPHDLRRTVRTLLGYLDCPAEVAESILGHKADEIVATYNLHTYDRQKREWLTRLAEHLKSLESVDQLGAPVLP